MARVLAVALGEQHDVGGHVRIRAPQAVARPRAEARAPRDLRTSVDQSDARVVVDRLGVHRVNHRDLVGNVSSVRDEAAHPRPGLAMLLHRRYRATHQELFLASSHPGHALSTSNTIRQLAAVQSLERGGMIDQVDVRRTAGLE